MVKKNIFIAGLLSILSIGLFSAGKVVSKNNEVTRNNAVEQFVGYTGSYYDGISDSLEGTSLLSALRTLNANKKKKNVGYDGFRQFAALSDVNPDGGNQIVGFYDNTLVGPAWDYGDTWNREHMWPRSRKGSNVENDAHMVRPTSTSINSERGNLFYGLAPGTYDPGQYFADYRGIAARVIFYCVVADTELSLVDLPNDSASNGTMGTLSTLLKWNLEYLPGNSTLELRTEQNRNNVIENHSQGQGNRNPFIDHPEYACKIWGNTNDVTKAICGGGSVEESLDIYGELDKDEYYIGETFDPTGLSVEYTLNGTTTDVTDKVTWNLGKFDKEGSFDLIATYQGLTAKYLDKINVYEYIPDEELIISGTLKTTDYKVGDWLDPTGVTVTYVCDGVSTNVTSKVTWDPMLFDEPGDILVNVYYESEYSYLGASYGYVHVSDGSTPIDSSSEETTSDSSSETPPPSETSSDESSEITPPSSSEITSQDSSSSSGEKPTGGGGCKASIGGSNSIIFILGFVALYFAIKKVIKKKKEA